VGYVAASIAVEVLAGRLVGRVVAAAIVALAALPVRDVLQRLVNTVLYGDRDDPYRAVSRLTERLDAVASQADTLPIVVRTMAESMRLPYVAVELGEELLVAGGSHLVGALNELPLITGSNASLRAFSASFL
jgi:hypothetical protein